MQVLVCVSLIEVNGSHGLWAEQRRLHPHAGMQMTSTNAMQTVPQGSDGLQFFFALLILQSSFYAGI